MRICLLLFLFGEYSSNLDLAFETALKRVGVFYPGILSELTVVKRNILPKDSAERMEAVLSEGMYRFLDSDCLNTRHNLNSSAISAPFRAVISTGATREATILGDIGREEDTLVMISEAITSTGNEQNYIERFPTMLRMSNTPIEQMADAVIHALVHLGCGKYTFVYEREPQDELTKQRLGNLRDALRKYDDLHGSIGKWRRKIERYDLPASPVHLTDQRHGTIVLTHMQAISSGTSLWPPIIW
ncbi:hypothetical protein RvY_10711-2 [Ramazzottius varieornatus]|uniref:Uncharacterized protein n=1 Tax=Ramazzottius varieornatus TaxID=947166 RepID=A0A1D1VMN4_RAMVA|nr:hypothetical protein RvY_10711-2 [Ramazzottius varieornatus]